MSDTCLFTFFASNSVNGHGSFFLLLFLLLYMFLLHFCNALSLHLGSYQSRLPRESSIQPVPYIHATLVAVAFITPSSILYSACTRSNPIRAANPATLQTSALCLEKRYQRARRYTAVALVVDGISNASSVFFCSSNKKHSSKS